MIDTNHCEIDFETLDHFYEATEWLTEHVGLMDDMWSRELAVRHRKWVYRFYFRDERDLTLFILGWA